MDFIVRNPLIFLPDPLGLMRLTSAFAKVPIERTEKVGRPSQDENTFQNVRLQHAQVEPVVVPWLYSAVTHQWLDIPSKGVLLLRR